MLSLSDNNQADVIEAFKQKVGMIRQYHNHKLQTHPRHREEEPQDIYSNKTSERQ